MGGTPIDILALTSDRFAAAAAGALAIPETEAMRIYRAFYREGRAAPDGVGPPAPPVQRVESEGLTRKFTQRLDGGLDTESVILPQRSRTGRLRHTLCVSSQVGCGRACTFCETGRMGLRKNLTAREIVAQWRAARFDLRTTITNVVFMGMGEPLDNLDNVTRAIEVLADRNGPAVAASRIAVSTAGHIDGIVRLASFARRAGFHKLRLAVSLNAPNDEVRSRIMPINRSMPMADLMTAMRGWPGPDRMPILIEYVLIPGVNDQPEHADEVSEYLEPLSCTVNVIPYNPRRGSPWPAPEESAVDRFVERVRARGRRVRRRRTMGRSVMAACGQLGNPAVGTRGLIQTTTRLSELNARRPGGK